MKTTIAVLRGGMSQEYGVSLKSGAAVLEHLDRTLYRPVDLFIDRSGQWHRGGMPMLPAKALQGVDVAFNVLHGKYGEDGSLQRQLDALGVRYTGPGSFHSAISFNKHRTKEALVPHKIKVARSVVIRREEDIAQRSFELFRTFPMPAIVKPVIGGSSTGMTLARSVLALQEGIEKALREAPQALVEEYIRGREATVGVIDQFRGEKTYALFPIEIIPPPTSDFFDHEAKYSGESQEICPGNFSRDEKEQLMSIARRVHEAMQVSQYSRSDFIVSPRGIYFLEINPAPAVGLTNESLMPKALRAVGSTLPEFLSHVITLAQR